MRIRIELDPNLTRHEQIEVLRDSYWEIAHLLYTKQPPELGVLQLKRKIGKKMTIVGGVVVRFRNATALDKPSITTKKAKKAKKAKAKKDKKKGGLRFGKRNKA